MEHKLLLLTKDNEQYAELIKNSALPNIILLGDEPKNIKEATIWLADPALSAPIVGHATNLKWLQSTCSNVSMLLQPRLRKDYRLTNINGIYGPVMAEFIYGHLLNHQQNNQPYCNEKIWQTIDYKKLENKCLLLLGTGILAQHLAKTATQFGMKILGINQTGVETVHIDKTSTLDHLSEYIQQADAVVNTLPKIMDTHYLLDEHTLKLMKKDAVFYNLGSDDMIDLETLNQQLIDNPSQYAVLDIANQTPLSLNHPLRNRSNISISPYIAAPSFPEQITEIFSHNYYRYIQGEPLNHQVCFKQDC